MRVVVRWKTIASKNLSPSEAICAGPESSTGVFVRRNRACVDPVATRVRLAAMSSVEPIEAKCLVTSSWVDSLSA